MALHPTLDVLMTGGRDSVCRVWDMRTKVGSLFSLFRAAYLCYSTKPQLLEACCCTTWCWH